jgi:ABC-type glycerol-3-phosphate transport system permease component
MAAVAALAGHVRPRARPQLRGRVAHWSAYAVLTLASILCIFPILWVVLTSLRTADSAFGRSFVPTASEWTAIGYVHAFTQAHVGGGILNSLIVTGCTICCVLFIAVLGGYGFARFAFFGSRSLYLLIVSTLMIPIAAMLIPLFLEIKMFHLLDSLPGLILIYTATSVPFAVVLMRGFFQRSPAELADAARIDGAGEWSVFLRVMVPLVKPAILTLAVFQFLFSWNEFLLAETFLSSAGKLTLQPRIYAIVGMYSTNWPLLCASLVIAMLPIVVLYIVIQRRFVAGLTAGALRG